MLADPPGVPSQSSESRCSNAPSLRMISDSAWNWIAVNAVQQSSLNKKDQNMTIPHLKKINQPVGSAACTPSYRLSWSPALRFRGGRKRVVPPPDGGYPGFTTAEGPKPFLASPPALRTQQLVGLRSLATPPAASTPALALERLLLNTADKIRPLALQRSC